MWAADRRWLRSFADWAKFRERGSFLAQRLGVVKVVKALMAPKQFKWFRGGIEVVKEVFSLDHLSSSRLVEWLAF